MQNQLDALEIIRFLHLEVKKMGAVEVSVNCPFCVNKQGKPDFKGHMSINQNKNTYHCHRCGKGGSLVSLYATLSGLPYSCREERKEAYKSFYKALRGDSFQPIFRKQKSIQQQTVSNLVEQGFLEEVYERLLAVLPLSITHEEKLLERGFRKEDIWRLGYRSAPLVGGKKIASTLLEQGYNLSKVPGFYICETGEWDIVSIGSGIFIPQRNVQGKIVGFQTRLDRPQKCKFFTFSGANQPGGTSARTQAHFTGYTLGATEVVITEGAMKADLASSLSGQFFLSIPGVTQYAALSDSLPVLVKLGISTVKLAFDMDKKENPNVMAALEKALVFFFQAGFSIYTLDWMDEYQGHSLKGIDDFYKGFQDGLPLTAPTITPFTMK